jgi:hypothetical protein
MLRDFIGGIRLKKKIFSRRRREPRGPILVGSFMLRPAGCTERELNPFMPARSLWASRFFK